MALSAPCGDEREREVVRLWQNGHLSRGTTITYLHWVRLFRAYCRNRRLDEAAELTLDGAVRFTRAYVGPRKKGPVAGKSGDIACRALRAWACALRSLKISVPEWRPRRVPAPLPPLLGAYCHYRRSHCGVAEGTLKRDVEVATAFLLLLRDRRRPVQRAAVADIDAFVSQLSASVSRRSVADRCSSLRSFLRFLHTTGRLSRELAACVVSPRIHIAERPPRALPWADVRRILHAIPQKRPPGKRDFAMLLMLATYGLGAGEVLALRLEDVDWKFAKLRVRRPKTGVAIDLPLLAPVARALAAYLETERPPQAQSRRIFLGKAMPYEPITSGAIRHRIRLYADRAGVTAQVIGAHAFRHSHACRQVDAGANIKVVSDILGHRRPSSTSIYVRVALRRLRAVALPVPR
jgi:integrase/recombinase XerD